MEIKPGRKGAAQFAPLSNLHKIVDTVRDSKRCLFLLIIDKDQHEYSENPFRPGACMVLNVVQSRTAISASPPTTRLKTNNNYID